MNIKMIGIDHSVASLAYRELFSFTKKSCAAIMSEFVKRPGIQGCVMISTCNRMEVWVSHSGEGECSVLSELCRIRQIDEAPYRDYFVEREGVAAVEHLFSLACGLKSRIMGEDQIITQVKDALSLAREHYCTDNVLEVLFRMAVTAAKKVKTNVHISTANYSAINEAIRMLKDVGYDFRDKTCMVIGNGEMGKLAATALREEGADVTVTVRQYKSGVVAIPNGCKRINYGDRMEYFPKCDIVVSATSSPNVTIKYAEVEALPLDRPKILIDLAVPRDIDPRVQELENVTLYDIDQFHVDLLSDEARLRLQEAENILREQISEFVTWYECRDLIPTVQSISQDAATDVSLRLGKTLRQLDISQEEKKGLEEAIIQASSKVVSKLLFGIRDMVSTEAFRACAEAIEKLY